MSEPTPAEMKALVQKHGLTALVCIGFAAETFGGVSYGTNDERGVAAGGLMRDICEALESGALHFPEELKHD